MRLQFGPDQEFGADVRGFRGKVSETRKIGAGVARRRSEFGLNFENFLGQNLKIRLFLRENLAVNTVFSTAC